MDEVRIGVQIRPAWSEYSQMAAALDRAEALGVDIVFTWDHFFPIFGDTDGKHFECWTLLAAFAERSTEVQIGALVTGNSYRNPQLLADMARTVDHISGGRAILGIGSGWFEKDYAEYGYDFGTPASRLRDLGRDLPLIKDRLAQLNPPPIGRLPILIGGGGEKVTLRLVAEHADIWHVFGTPDTLRHKAGVLDRWCERIGRDPASIERATGAAAMPAEGVRALGDEIHDAGFRQIAIGIDGPEFDFSGVDEWLAWRDDKNGA